MIKLFVFAFFLSLTGVAADDRILETIEARMNTQIEEKALIETEKAQLETQIEELQAKIRERKILLVNRLRALYSMKRFRWGELLLNTELSALNRNMKILGNINKSDYELFREYNGSLRLLAQARKNLTDTEQQLQKNIQALQLQEVEFYKIEDLRQQTLQQNKIASLLTSKGKLSRPLDGTPAQEFGSVRDQHRQYFLINRGEFYKTKKSVPVRAVGLGAVIFRDVLAGWRETLVVQHDDNYYTVYAGIKNSGKNVGDAVFQNEVLGVTAAEEFYFELRHYDNPINPKKWYGEQK